MTKFHMDTASVHKMGHDTRDVAKYNLTAAKRDVEDAYDHYTEAHLHGFETGDVLKSMLHKKVPNAKSAVSDVHTMGDLLDASANAAAHGDEHGADSFKSTDLPEGLT